MTPRPSEKGVALLTTLILVAFMAAIAVSVLDDIRFAIRRTSNMSTLGQAQWYALAAETLAKARLERVLAERRGYVTLDGGWSGSSVDYPIDHGAVRMRLSDRGACFNLNSVVTGEPGAFVVNPTGLAQYRSLLTALGLPESQAASLADALADWVDSDARPQPFGAEDPAYARQAPPYRTSGALLAEETELRAVRGYTPEVYRTVRPFVCALPLPQLSDVNLNTLTLQDAPVLSAIYAGRLDVGAARRLVEARPQGGWPNQEAFLQEPLLRQAAREGGAPPVQQLVVRSRFFALEGEVALGDMALPYSALIEAHPSGRLVTAARRWTAAE